MRTTQCVYSNFKSHLNHKDLQVREHLKDYDASFVKLSFNQRLTFTFDKFLFKFKISKYDRFRRMKNIDIIFFKDENIENGYPHTVNRCIMLPIKHYFSLNQKDRIMLLIHEYIHIFQRFYSFEFNKFLLTKFNLFVHDITDRIHLEDRRYNPDINNLLYSDGGYYNVTLYDENPKTLSDSKIYVFGTENINKNRSKYSEFVKNYENHLNLQMEHPHETFACIMSYLIMNDILFDKFSADHTKDIMLFLSPTTPFLSKFI